MALAFARCAEGGASRIRSCRLRRVARSGRPWHDRTSSCFRWRCASRSLRARRSACKALGVSQQNAKARQPHVPPSPPFCRPPYWHAIRAAPSFPCPKPPRPDRWDAAAARARPLRRLFGLSLVVFDLRSESSSQPRVLRLACTRAARVSACVLVPARRGGGGNTHRGAVTALTQRARVMSRVVDDPEDNEKDKKPIIPLGTRV